MGSSSTRGDLPRRFVFVITALARGGMLSVMHELWQRLGRRGAVEVIAHGPNRVAVPVPSHEIGLRHLSSPYRFPHVLFYAARVCAACVRAVRQGPRPAVLLPQDALGTGFGALLAGRLTGTPVVVMEHGGARAIHSDFFWRERLKPARPRDRLTRPLLKATLHLMYRASLRMLDAALLPSDEAVEMYRRGGVARDRIFRYHVPIDVARFRPGDATERAELRRRLGLPPDAGIVLSVSRLAPEKGLDLLVESVAALGAARNGLVLVIAGEGPLDEQLQAQARRLDVPARLTGLVSADDLPRLLRCADVFVYAARQGSNVPVAVLEAMASGLAVVATTEPVAHVEILRDGRGTVIPPENASAMTEAIGAYLEDPEARSSAGTRARRYVEANHAPDVLDRELDALFEAMSPRRGHTGGRVGG